MTGVDGEVGALRESVRRFLATSYAPDVRRRLIDDPTGHDRDMWRVVAEQLGLAGLAIPEAYGGSGASAGAWQAAFQELGAALYCGPLFATAALAAPALLAAADEQARSEFLPRIADGSLIATLASTEPGRGWALADVATTALPTGADSWAVSGTKAYVVDVQAADLILVTARTPDGLGLFAVEPDAAGLTIGVQPSIDLTRRLGRVELEDTPARRMSGPDDVTIALESARDRSFIALTAEQVGVASAALTMAVDYAVQREQFGRTIGQFQAIKHMCAEMLVDLEAAGALAGALARSADTGEELAVLAALAKALCSEVAFSVAARMVQVHGGIGFTWEHDAHLYYRRAKSVELMFGDAAEQRRRLATLVEL